MYAYSVYGGRRAGVERRLRAGVGEAAAEAGLVRLRLRDKQQRLHRLHRPARGGQLPRPARQISNT